MYSAILDRFHDLHKDMSVSLSFICVSSVTLYNVVVLFTFFISLQYMDITHTKLQLMVTYFCYHLSDNYVDLSDLYVDLSVICVELSDHFADFSEKITTTSSLMSCVISFNASNCHYLSIWYLTSRHNYLKSSFQTMMSICQIFMLTCQTLCRLVR